MLVLLCFQVLRQLAPDVSYRSLVALGVASIQGLPVASFDRDDAERVLFFCSRHGKDTCTDNLIFSSPPSWLRPPAPSRKRVESSQGTTPASHDGASNKIDEEVKDTGLRNGVSMPMLPARKRLKVAAMRPIPHVRRHKMTPFSGMSEADGHDGGQAKANLPVVTPAKHNIVGSTPPTQRRSYSSSSQAKQIISLNPLPLKKHGCGRSPMQNCSEVNCLICFCGTSYKFGCQTWFFWYSILPVLAYCIRLKKKKMKNIQNEMIHPNYSISVVKVEVKAFTL